MTENEAIQQLKFDQAMMLFDPANGETSTLEEIKLRNEDEYKTYLANELAIIALKAIHQYREIGTVEECLHAMERQSAKNPNIVYKNKNMIIGKCPTCNRKITHKYERRFCNKCGQRLDWGTINK